MFNKKLKAQIKKLMEDGTHIANTQAKIYNDIYGENFFFKCPCYKSEKSLLKTSSDTKSFNRLIKGTCSMFDYIEICYTTKKEYDEHLSMIKKIEKEVKEFKLIKKD